MLPQRGKEQEENHESNQIGPHRAVCLQDAFGALPIQRISHADAVKLVRRAYESGINYFDHRQCLYRQ